MKNIYDNYLIEIIFDYLLNIEIGYLKCIDKKFLNDIIYYQKNKIKKLLKNNFFSEFNKNIINNNSYKDIFISDTKIIEEIYDRSFTVIIGISKINKKNISIYFLKNNNFELEYILSINIDYFDKLYNIECLYLGGDIYFITNKNIIKYNLLTKNLIKNSLNHHDYNKIKSLIKCTVYNNEIYILQSYWDIINDKYNSYPLCKLLYHNNSYENYLYNLSTNLNKSRRFHGFSVYNNQLFVAGGVNGNNCLNSVEIFNDEKQVWEKQKNGMVKNRSHFKLTVIEDDLYAIGGDFPINNISIEKYDNKNKIWNIVTYSNSNFYNSTIINRYNIYFFKEDNEFNNKKIICDIYDIKNNIWDFNNIDIIDNFPFYDTYLYSEFIKIN